MSTNDVQAAGEFARWRAQIVQTLEAGAEIDVPCGSCTACCRSNQFVHVEADEQRTRSLIPAAFLFPAPGAPEGTLVLGFDQQGRCPMLGQTGCSIYEHRPRACRTYDCRVFAATGVSNDQQPSIDEQAQRWRFDYVDASARHAHCALRDFARVFESELDAAPKNATDLALQAIMAAERQVSED